MKRYIDYNVSDGSINCIRIIQESNYALYNTTSLLEIELRSQNWTPPQVPLPKGQPAIANVHPG